MDEKKIRDDFIDDLSELFRKYAVLAEHRLNSHLLVEALTYCITGLYFGSSNESAVTSSVLALLAPCRDEAMKSRKTMGFET